MSRPDLDSLMARFAIEDMTLQDAMGSAIAALEAGLDSPSLRILAGVRDVPSEQLTREELCQLINQVAVELGLKLPSKREAILWLATRIARQILQGSVTPYQGAKQIWALSHRIKGEAPLPELDTFVYGASEWEDRPSERAIFEEGIILAAQDLVQRGSRGDFPGNGVGPEGGSGR